MVPDNSAGAAQLASDDFLQTSQAIADGRVKDAVASQPASRATSQPTTANAQGRTYVPFKDRYGPAYPGDFWYSWGRNGKETPLVLWDDTKAIATNPVSLIGLGAAAAAGITLGNTRVDYDVANYYRREGHRHHQMNSFWNSVGSAGGNPATAFAVAGAAYVLTLATNDTRDYEATKSLGSSLMLTGILVEALKVSCHTHSPNGDSDAFPSGHTASSFAFATVLEDYYGPWAGVPAYGFAGFVGWERLDSRNHQFSDVVAGALIGFAIAHGVDQNHKARQIRVLGMDVVPYIDPDTSAAGVALVRSW